MKNPFRKKALAPREVFIRTYLDSIAPGVVKFEVDHYIFGNTYRCIWALREYPASTESQAILRHLGEKSGVTLRIYCRQVSPGEEDRIIDNANKKNKLDGSDPNKLRQAVEAESNLRDVAELVHKMHREHEPLLHCAVYLEMTADSAEHLRQLQTDVLTELVRCKLNVDKLLLRQKQGFYCASPVGYNALGREFERVLPAGSVANLYPFNYSGKTDPNGFYIGKDKYGSNIVVDYDRRDSDKTSANILILGNSGQGKSYLMKLLICNLLETGKSVVSLDAEHELEDLCGKLGGCFIDLMAGEKRINVLEVRCWNEDTEADESAPEAFRKSTLLARHISFLKDFSRAYGYLPKEVKAQVDEIVEQLAQLLEVAACYDQWWRLKDEIAGYYGRNTPPHQPLVLQKEFRAIKNFIIREAETICEPTPVQTSTDAEKNEQQNPLDETPTAVQQPQIAPLQNALTADAVMQLLHHMSRMFRGNMPVIPPALRIDSKRRRRLQEKRMAMGRKWDDHEDEQLHHVNDNTMR